MGVARRRQACGRARSFRHRSRPAASASTSAPRPAASPRCCSRAARGASTRSTSDAASCMRACAAAPTSSRSKRPTSASSTRHGSTEPPDLVTVDVSFISLKLVLPAALALARQPAEAGRADQAAIRGRAATTSRRAWCAIRQSMRRSAPTFAHCVASLGWTVARRHPLPDRRRRRQPRIPDRAPGAARATPFSCHGIRYGAAP